MEKDVFTGFNRFPSIARGEAGRRRWKRQAQRRRGIGRMRNRGEFRFRIATIVVVLRERLPTKFRRFATDGKRTPC